jgi:two-component system, NtrC family, nitrogen regulation sensor histidine kinase NtrY
MGYLRKIKSKTRLLVWLTILFALFWVISVAYFQEINKLLLIVFEILVPVLFGITIWMINKDHQPIQTIGRSMNMLREGDFTTTLTRTGTMDVDQIVEVYNSMIKRLREERLSVREKNQFLDLLIESSPLGLIIVDFSDRITDINPAAVRYLGISEDAFLGKTLKESGSPILKQLAVIDYAEKKYIDLPDGMKYLCRKEYFMDHGYRHPFFMIEEFSEEIRKAERDAYGKLIRMMAHEVNNTVGAVNSIMSSVQFQEKIAKGTDYEEIVHILGVAIQRNYQLNRFMQNFSHMVKIPAPEKSEVELTRPIKNVIDSYLPLLNERNIILSTEFQDPSARINADQVQMEQVFVNILKNSIEAIGKDGAILVRSLENPARIMIRDSGPGLSDEARANLFTPFFSTKAGGQGIGLTLVREILVNHGFSFRLSNLEQGGAEFEITFR